MAQYVGTDRHRARPRTFTNRRNASIRLANAAYFAPHPAKLRRASYITVMTDLTVWHDGACPLCQREIALMRRLDRRGAITFIDAADDDSMCPVDRADLLARFHASEDGRMLSGAAAFGAMWRAIPLLRPLGIAARNRWVLAILDRAYLGFLVVRPALQRLAGKQVGA